MKQLSPKFHALALAAGLLLAAAPAHAVGQLMDVNVIDRDSGQRQPVVWHDGQWWTVGRPGARYAIEARNQTSERIEIVASVDGVNVISGETADWQQRGYVLRGWETYRITGWRKSNAEVAAFNFTALSNSYAARTGRPGNVGVIGVAAFREQRRQAEVYEKNRDSTAEPLPAPPSATAAPAPAPAQSRQAPADESRAVQRLGTGHGARERSQVSDTTFDRLSGQPDEIIAIRYDSCENLAAQGVLPADACRRKPPPAPLPFPDSPRRFTPDPPPRY